MAKLDVTVHGVFRNDNDEVLLEKTKKGWTLPGGHVERGQGVLDALKDELRKETGKKWDTRVDCLLAVYLKFDNRGMPKKVMFIVRGKYLSGTPKAKHEVEKVKWVSMKEARKRLANRRSERWVQALEDSLREPQDSPVFRAL